ncbi:two-component system response regulator [Solitalea longa]|uniref:Two-component system response regulator n=1 Tax=Solitalea longa TaxID=2079460 RepID=A0A2S4ZYZ7_9SPHI|nr:response regulator [Solitalea longa]POY35217.1 two-component system response regulator [Solitalea longa]
MTDEQITILYIDDEPHNLTAFKAAFRREYTIFIAESAAEGRKILDNNDIHILITDQRMPNITGIEFLESILEIHPNPIRMLLTGYADISAVIDAINKGQVYRYISKPWDEQELRQNIKNGYDVYMLRKKNKQLTEDLASANDQLEFLLRQKLLS